jgi:hypothetical protein
MKYIKKIPFAVNALIFIITLYLNSLCQLDTKKWEIFSDVKDYLHQSTLSLGSKDFYAGKPEPNYYPRPFTVPLFYKLAGSKGESIVKMQKFMHSLAAFVLVYALLLALKTGLVRYLAIFLIYFLMSWWNILGWTTQLLSESLSLSFLFLWIGTFLIYCYKRTPWFLVIHCLITILFSFTRDSWPYILLLYYILIVIIFWLWNKPLLKGAVIMLILSVAIFFIQDRCSAIGERTKLPLVNTILLRILPERDNFNWFVIKGMPMAGTIKQRFTGIDINTEGGLYKVWGTYWDLEYKPFRDWAAGPGKRLYMRFLITHPAYSLLLREPKEKLKRIISINLEYGSAINGYSVYTEFFLPLFSPILLLIDVILLLWIFIKSRNSTFLLPVVMVIVFLFNVLLLYNADALEVGRHMFVNMVMVQLLSIWSLCLVFDEVIQKTSFSGKE